MDVRTQARNVRSFAEWSLKFLIILSANMNPRNGTINTKRIGAQRAGPIARAVIFEVSPESD